LIVTLDTNCLVAGLLSSQGPCAEILDRWRDGQFDVAVSPRLLEELSRVLDYPRIRKRYAFTPEAARSAVAELREEGLAFGTPDVPPRSVPGDPDDDHIVALAEVSASALLVTRDAHFREVDAASCSARIVDRDTFVEMLRADATLEH
jgi:putative PIN family toxin of toxin-antitoxin system